MRPGERAVVGAGIGALVLVALWGVLSAPSRDVDDQRLSTYLTGPSGAKGLAQALRRLGLTVEQRRRPYFDLAADSGRRRPERLFAFLDIERPTWPELAAIRDFVTGGGRILTAGVTGIEACFGYRSRRLDRDVDSDTRATVVPVGGRRLPPTWRVLRRLSAESLAAATGRGGTERCVPQFAARVDTLARTLHGGSVALRLHFASGGEAILVADEGYLTNRTLRDTDAGVDVLPWFVDGRTRQVVVDEYHLGFGAGGSLPGASWAWLRQHPPGWAILQLLGVALVALAITAVRFGPARSVIERRRRSPLEHLEALAAGLEGAGGVDTAVGLMVSGLRRRLGRLGLLTPGAEGAWLAALELALPTAAGRVAVRRLQRTLTQPGGPERALAAAQAVEDVWEALRPRTTRA
jgi:uncharacterized protein DUF4350